jgi:hypothetical protein
MERGQVVNPLRLTPPPPEPLPASMMAAFGEVCGRDLALLDKQPGVRMAAGE